MDITARYRTKYPPKEHDEAVKMLLEGIKARQADKAHSSSKTDQQLIRSDGSKESSSGYDCDRISQSSSDVQINRYLASKLTAAKERANAPKNLDELASISSRKMQSIGTSTLSDSTSSGAGSGTSSAGEQAGTSNQADCEAPLREPIPSRTIAVQCDLKISSVRQRDYIADGSMQASSISSTRYGFYSYSPETLERRRRFQRSVSSRDIRDQEDLERQQSGLVNGSKTLRNEFSSSSSCLSSHTSRSDQRPTQLARTDHKQEVPTEVDKLDHQPVLERGWTSNSQVSDETKAAKKSKIITRYNLQDSNRPPNVLKSRARSHMTLADTGPDHNQRQVFESSRHSSDSELVPSHSDETGKIRSGRTAQSFEPQGLSSQLDLSFIKPPRPKLISSSHNEHVRELDDVQLRPVEDNESPKYLARAKPSRELRQSATMSRVDRSTSLKGANYSNMSARLEKNLDTPRSVARPNIYGHAKASDPTTVSRGLPLGSMSLSRHVRPAQQYRDENTAAYERYRQDLRVRSSKSPNHSRAHRDIEGQENHVQTRSSSLAYNEPGAYVGRSISMRQSVRPEVNQRYHHGSPVQSRLRPIQSDCVDDVETSSSSASLFAAQNPFNCYREDGELVTNLRVRSPDRQQDESEDSESPMTRTWANPAAISRSNYTNHNLSQTQDYYLSNADLTHPGRKASRSQSMRNVHDSVLDKHIMIRPVRVVGDKSRLDHGQDYSANYCSSSEESFPEDKPANILGSADLNFDSQHRLNESGLPDPGMMTSQYRLGGTSSYLGLNRNYALEAGAHTTSLRRPTQIAGRAMSQQSLSRPSMPLMTSRGRRRGPTNSRAGSDVGGSSMSLISRLNGRYEGAHTRAPVVMYIPQATSKPNELNTVTKTSTARRGARLRHSSQDRGSHKSLASRNGSDSESSSMLRTLVKPRAKLNITASRRSSRRHLNPRDSYDEDLDDIGQLATEIDSYKFRRRYSVPKDAKINWFAKLKQRVSSTVK